jgi:hypothetical protein
MNLPHAPEDQTVVNAVDVTARTANETPPDGSNRQVENSRSVIAPEKKVSVLGKALKIGVPTP